MRPDSSREVFRGIVVRVEEESWGDDTWEIVRHPGAAAVLPLTPTGEVILVRQLRRSVRRTLLEVPAGLLDVENEEPIDAARRELLEETGYRAARIRSLGSFLASLGFTDEIFHLFAAETDPEPSAEPEEGIELVRMPFAEAVRAARDGRLADVKSALSIMLTAADPVSINGP